MAVSKATSSYCVSMHFQSPNSTLIGNVFIEDKHGLATERLGKGEIHHTTPDWTIGWIKIQSRDEPFQLKHALATGIT